jgi:23S rRNA pseudouridine2604 synthase
VTETSLRLSKLMAQRGLCSRREADTYIERGWVKVDGRVVDIPGSKVEPDCQIELAGAAEREQANAVTILLNKPVGYVSSQAEPGYRPAIQLITPANRDPQDQHPRLFSQQHTWNLATAGRLDIDSTGLLVLTQDGRIARQLIGEDSDIEKEYLVRVQGRLDERGFELLNHGLMLDGKPLKPAQVDWQNRDQLRFILREGKKRQIRRMCELVGLKVTGLKRTRIGDVKLGNLAPGNWRYLADDEYFRQLPVR